jgi:hypothetical protein
MAIKPSKKTPEHLSIEKSKKCPFVSRQNEFPFGMSIENEEKRRISPENQKSKEEEEWGRYFGKSWIAPGGEGWDSWKIKAKVPRRRSKNPKLPEKKFILEQNLNFQDF